MSLKEKPHKGGRKFSFSRGRKTKNKDFRKDSGDLVQTVIIIAAMVVASVVVVGGVSSVTQSKGKSTAECINNATNFGQGAVVRENCKKTDEEAQEKGEEAIVGNFGGGENESEEELITPTDDNCFVLNETGDTIIEYKYTLEECNSDVVIPEEINGKTIKHIGDMAFVANFSGATLEEINMGITSVVFPDNVETIGAYAFFANPVEKINVPNSLQSVGDMAFYEGNINHDLVFPEGVTSIDRYAFAGNEITSVKFPDSLTEISAASFASNNISNIELSSTLTAIRAAAFSGNNISSIELPDSLREIELAAFSENNISEVDFPQGLTMAAGFSSNNLSSISFPDSVKAIGDFESNNMTIDVLELPPNLETIGGRAFFGNNINKVVIPDTVTYIGIHAFTSVGLKELTLPNNEKTKIEQQVFKDNELTELTIPEKMRTIPDLAFANNKITNVIFHKEITRINRNAFTGNSITNVTIPKDAYHYLSFDSHVIINYFD